MKSKEQLIVWRFRFVAGVITLLPLALAWHLANLQVVPKTDGGFEFLQKQGEARTIRSQEVVAYRGVITDRNGELLAVSTPVKSLFLDPQKFDRANVGLLAKALNQSTKELAEKLDTYSDKQFMYLARHLPPQEAEVILAKRIPGIYAQTEYRRFYPAGEVTAHVLGFTDVEDSGQEGIELAYNEWLSGTPGLKRVIKDLKGNVVRDEGLVQAPIPGKDLQLSIDLRLQYLAHRELKEAIAQQGAKSGSLVLLDVATGDVLAMVNQPSYNPNNRVNIRPELLRNRAITDLFEPGSTMKPFTVMAALETGKYSPNYKINTSPGYIRVGRKTIVDHRDYGVIDLPTIIAKSSQVGISKLALEMDGETIRDMYFRMGLGQATGIGFPGEANGFLPTHNKWRPIEQATFAYGYGLSVNTVQLAQAYSVIAAKGQLHPVSLLHRASEQLASSEVVSSHVADDVGHMLELVTQKGGTGTRAQIDSYPVAGKSGTAHKVGKDGYEDDKYVAVFAGMAPAKNPVVVAAVMVNEPSNGKYFGGEAAAPVFSKVVEKSLRVLRVPPLEMEEQVASVGWGHD